MPFIPVTLRPQKNLTMNNSPEENINPWASEQTQHSPPKLAPRRSYSSTPARSLSTRDEPFKLNDLPTHDESDKLLLKQSLIHQIEILRDRLQKRLERVYKAQAEHREQVCFSFKLIIGS